jgi:hypothetical protein
MRRRARTPPYSAKFQPVLANPRGNNGNDVKNIESRPRKQISRRQAFLERQRLVAERAAKKEAGKAAKALPASLHTQGPPGKGSRNLSPDTLRRQDFARAIARAEARPRWQSSPEPVFRAGQRIYHRRFGHGHVAAIDRDVLHLL